MNSPRRTPCTPSRWRSTIRGPRPPTCSVRPHPREVKNLAEVSVNGKHLGIAWKTPYRVDVTSALKPGKNSLEIRVTNAGVHRIIGDRQPSVTKTYTFTSLKFYKADSKLVASGLLGPVRIISPAEEQLK
jgi:hypothetical protein